MRGLRCSLGVWWASLHPREGCYKAFTAFWRRRAYGFLSTRYLPLILLAVIFQERHGIFVPLGVLFIEGACLAFTCR